MKTLESYIKDLRSQGQSCFTTQEAEASLGISRTAVNARIYRLKKKGELVSPARNLYIIIPPEFRSMGCIPAADLVPLLMKHWEQDYYAGLLTAALYHGASHQKPQVFQVVVDKQIATLTLGRIRIEFITKKFTLDLPLQDIEVKTGYLKVSSPEVTVMDLLLYPNHVGGINATATILSELIDALNPQKMKTLAVQLQGKAWVQRLGWILEHIETVDEKKKVLIIGLLGEHLNTQKLFYIPAAPELETTGFPRNKKWKIIENTNVESDYDT